MQATGAIGALRWRRFLIVVVGLFSLLANMINAHSAPITSPQYFSGSKDTAIAGALTATGSGGVFSFSLVTAPSNGTVALNAGGSFTYTPLTGFTGVDSFLFQVDEASAPHDYSVNSANITIFDTIPRVSSVSVPVNGYYKVGEKLDFSVTFDQIVFVYGSPFLSITIGSSTRSADYTSGSGTNVLTFSYTVQSGDMDMDGITLGTISANGGTISNNASESAVLSLNNVGSTSGVFVNTASPTVVITASSTPSDIIQHFVVTFSEAVTGLSINDFIFTTSGTIAINPNQLQTGNNLLYMFDVNVTGSGSLSVQLPAGAVLNIAGNGNIASNLVTVPILQATNANLQNIVPSTGSLDPVFSPSATAYSLSVPTNTDSLQLTPTSADPTATITVNGTAVTSGAASAALPLAAGSTTLTVVVTAQNGMTRIYTVNVTRIASADATLSSLIPSVGSLDPVFDKETLNYSVNVENTVESISFAATVSEPSARITVAGSSIGSGSSSAPVRLVTDANTVSIIVTAPSGINRTYTVVVSRTALSFPDPTLDPEVIGLLNAQTSAARRFVQVQTRNFQNRLEQLHDEGDRRKSSLGVRLGGQDTTQDPQDPVDPSSSASSTAISPLGYAPEKRDIFLGKAIGMKEPEQPAPSFDPDLGPFAFWSSGFVNFGERDSGKLDLDYTIVGVSGGIDYRFSERFVAGFGAGYGRDRTDIGDNGTESRANAYSAAIYGSYKPIDNFFIDALVGGSTLDFDSTRFIATDGSLTDGKRDGSQLFGSLTVTYEFRQETWLISPYGRLEMSRSWLDGYSESGDSIYRLTYGDQTVDTVTGVFGLRANYSIDYSWGCLTPGIRAEYAHDFQGSSRAAMGYSALGGLPYTLDVEVDSSNSANLGLSFDFSFANAWTTGIEYQTGFGGAGARDHAIAVRVGAKF